MSQISPPIRIVLAAAVLFLVAWMTVLKPKTPEAASPTPTAAGNVATGKPAVSAPGKIVEKAKAAATQTEASQSAAMGESTSAGSATKPGSATAATPATGAAAAAVPGALAGVPAPVAKAIAKQKIVVVGFFSSKSADDRAVRRALLKVDRWNGRVFVKAAPVAQISKWGRIARGVDVEQSPTVVVVGRDLKATPLVGYVDTRTIDQAVVDAMHNAGGIFTSAYLRDVNKVCAQASSALFAGPQPHSPAEAPKILKRDNKLRAAFVGDLRGVKAPARYKAFKAATVADAAAMSAVWVSFTKALGPHPSATTTVVAAVAADKRLAPIAKRFQRRMDKNHVLACSNG